MIAVVVADLPIQWLQDLPVSFIRLQKVIRVEFVDCCVLDLLVLGASITEHIDATAGRN